MKSEDLVKLKKLINLLYKLYSHSKKYDYEEKNYQLYSNQLETVNLKNRIFSACGKG